ncbi:hypothetical protein MF271_02815 [Deinococcus sp. KNUC1210]|uniref:hypothetical protein n=1 Tax=Deinococcus sp. KNUC1210 TaxID=2917691 RepID=UPI001EF11116|nr:hypothetical protein [Deinococcus sp. KNUC1210]ULH15594.1 hypothetical protein MF271_02815 [Deinococcus sp. KNUC1210]
MNVPVLLLGGLALAVAAAPATPTPAKNSPLLKPLPLSAACQKAGYTALQDAAGTVRVLRYVRTVPDNTQRLTQYYDAAGHLQSLKVTASGFVGLLYSLSARIDSAGNVVGETGFRSRFFTASLKSVILDVAPIRAGHCGPE